MIETTKRLEACILDILDTYTPLIGGVPLQMLEHHLRVNKHLEYNEEELRTALSHLLRNKHISRDVVAYKKED